MRPCGCAQIIMQEENKDITLKNSLFNIKVMVQPTPNPYAYKFVVNREVKASGKAGYDSKEKCGDNGLAKALFDVPGVTQIHFFENVITVSFNSGADLIGLEEQVISVIKEKMPDHNPDFAVEGDETQRRFNLPHDLKKIEEILDRTIRPGLQGDGGDLEVVSLVDKQLSVRYQGACGTCPSSSMGTLMAIEGILKQEFDPDIEVQLV